jgi:hypothetical protein
VGSGARRILDLGANIGLTISRFAVLHPEERVVGVEMDAGEPGPGAGNVAALQSV